MADRVPSGYTRFLNRFLDQLPKLFVAQNADFVDCVKGARLLKSDYEVEVPHPLGKLMWAFRQNRLTHNSSSKTFNIEFVPHKLFIIDKSIVTTAWNAAKLDGKPGFQDSEFFFQKIWGTDKETERLVSDSYLVSDLTNWGIKAMVLAMEIVESARDRTKDLKNF